MTFKEHKSSVKNLVHCFHQEEPRTTLFNAHKWSWPDHLDMHILMLMSTWVWKCEWTKSMWEWVWRGKINSVKHFVNKYQLPLLLRSQTEFYYINFLYYSYWIETAVDMKSFDSKPGQGNLKLRWFHCLACHALAMWKLKTVDK